MKIYLFPASTTNKFGFRRYLYLEVSGVEYARGSSKCNEPGDLHLIGVFSNIYHNILRFIFWAMACWHPCVCLSLWCRGGSLKVGFISELCNNSLESILRQEFPPISQKVSFSFICANFVSLSNFPSYLSWGITWLFIRTKNMFLKVPGCFLRILMCWKENSVSSKGRIMCMIVLWHTRSMYTLHTTLCCTLHTTPFYTVVHWFMRAVVLLFFIFASFLFIFTDTINIRSWEIYNTVQFVHAFSWLGCKYKIISPNFWSKI